MNRPALIVELKWNRSEDAAIQQIREKKYPMIFRNYPGEVLLIGLTYLKNGGEHSCRIERWKS